MRNKRLITGLGLIAVCSILFTVSSSLMWFDNKTTITPDEVTGSSDGAYYASGSGTKDDPYIINQPRHLYNLAWLQYLGAYNKDTDGDGKINEIYFEVEGNTTNSGGDSVLDMSGWVLPPIGTEDNPFVGNFNGNNTIIKNLTVSNTFSDYEDNHPYYNAKNEVMSESTFTQPKIIGFFGVIGALDSQTYEYTSNIKVEGAEYTDANLVYDTYVDNITIENNTENQELLAGLLVGYVNAPIIQSGVGYGEFDFASGTTNLSSSNTPSGATINGVSNYSLIGAYNPNSFKYTGLPTTDSGSGDGNDWGGSIDFFHLTKRISYIMADNITYSSFQYSSTPNRFNVKKLNTLYFRQTSTGSWYPFYKAKTTSAYMDSGSYLPLNVDLDTEFPKDSNGNYTGVTSSTVTVGKNSVPYETNTFFTSNTEEVLATNSKGSVINTGYVTTGSSTGQSNATYLVSNYLSDATSSFGTTDNSYSDDYFVPLYYDYSSNSIKAIKSGANTQNNTAFSSLENIESSSLHQYESVKKNLSSFLNSESGLLHGIRWQNASISTLDGSFNINGITYSKLLSPGIDFVLSEDGYITCLYMSEITQSSNSLFDLYSVTRDGSTDSSTKENTGTPTYSQLTSVESNGKTYYTNNSIPTNKYKAIFYIEIPVSAGEYFITNSGSSVSSSILYLDIGANAGDSGSGDTPSKTSPTEIDFVYYDSKTKKLVKITSDGTYVNSEVVFQIGSSGTNLSGTYSFNRTTSSAVLYYQASEVITVIGTEANASKQSSKDDIPKNS